jgi:hypothetical protein
MKKIEKLTKYQESQLEVYKDKWLGIGLSTEQPSFERTKEIIDNVYTHLLEKTVVPIVILDNPFDTWKAICLYASEKNQVESQVENQVESQVWNQVRNQVRNQVENQVWNQVRNQVESQVWNQVRNQVWNQVRNQVESQVWNQVRNQVESQVWNQVRNQVRNQKLISFIYPYLDGNLMSAYFSFYDFCLNEFKIDLDIKFLNNFNIYKDISELSLIYPFDDMCFVCAKPVEIHFNENKVLHNSNGPSIKYRGDFELYHLNGVKVTKEIIKIKPNRITVNMILQEQNVEVRRELLRKLGIDDFIKKLKTKPVEVSKDKIYELYKIKLGEDLNGTYLKMKNPSLKDTYHFEGVNNECNTIEEALAWRDSEDGYIKPIELT